jgi:hypothetical protein
MTVDRPRRDELVQAIDRFLHEEINAFAFDEAIFEIRGKTNDATIHEVADFLYDFYDDFEDHPVVLNRIGWNCFQRIRLLLNSDAALVASTQRIWTASQLTAAAALAAFAWIVYQTGVGSHLWLVVVPFGFVSIALSAWRDRLIRNCFRPDTTLYPFDSLAQILWIGRDAIGFRKERFPAHLESRRIRDCGSEFVCYLQMYVGWVMYSPVALLAQLFPVAIPTRRVVH